MSYQSALHRPEFPRSNTYDDDLVLDGNMGPHPLWLTEWLVQDLELGPGARILDLGCGKALSSIFLARELDARVFAVDLWTSPDENWKRIVQTGEAGRVTPIHAEAHALPFASGYFDAIISIDAYQYFGSDVMYLFYLSRFLRAGGQIGIVMPGLMQPLPEGGVPDHLTRPQANGSVFWEDECVAFRTASAWQSVFAGCTQLERVVVDTLQDGWKYWRDHELAAEAAQKLVFPSVAETLERDAGRYLGFVRVRCRRNRKGATNLYDPDLVAKVTGRP